jgi:hypothetical protein
VPELQADSSYVVGVGHSLVERERERERDRDRERETER